MNVKRAIVALFCLFFPPSCLKNIVLRFFGFKLGKQCRIGFSFIHVADFCVGNSVVIGHGNYINVDSIKLKSDSKIGHLNMIFGPLIVFLDRCACVGNKNKIKRAKKPIVWGRAVFRLGIWSKITAGHLIDCTRGVSIGDYSIIAGVGTQLWTHGYLHAPEGLERFRIDGSIRIGSNVYIGSACVINAGIKIANAVTVGSASCVARSLDVAGLYVSQPLRCISLDYEKASVRYPAVSALNLSERVVNKRVNTNL